MNQNKDYEFVSAAMDDDLSEEALDKLLSDSGAQQKWHEYHVIRDCMVLMQAKAASNQDKAVQKNTGPVVKPAAAQMLDGTQGHAQRPAANHAFKGFAVAASVLAVAVGVWQFWPQTNAQQGAAVAQQAAPKPADKQEIVSVGGNAAAKTDAVANAEAQGTVVPHAARNTARQPSDDVEKQSAVRVEKLPENSAASAAR